MIYQKKVGNNELTLMHEKPIKTYYFGHLIPCDFNFSV
jgi:hypothetical protein